MKSRFFEVIVYAGGILAVLVLALLTWQSGDVINPDLTWLVFTVLFIFTSAFAVPLGGGFVSLLPLTSISAVLILGTVEAAFVVVIGEVLFGLLRWLLANYLEEAGEVVFSKAVRLTFANLAIQGFSVIGAGLIYSNIGGLVPLSTFTKDDFWHFLITIITYLAINYVLISAYMLLRDVSSLRRFLSTLVNLFLFEGLPTILAPLMALIYSWLGIQWLILFSLNLALASLIARSLALARVRLEKRVKELATLQAVGQTLSSTLHLDTVLKEIYRLIAELMPADVFYIALYDASIDQLTFPLVLENGKEVKWRSRRSGPGLTEYVIQSRHSLLISRRVFEQLKALGVAGFGKVAESWLGAPIMVGDEVIGVIAVQSYTQPGIYTPAFEQVLVTVAAQAGMAIHNARLYARIDETLERRVRELDSILQTTADGIILFDLDLQILAANPSLGKMLDVDLEDIVGKPLFVQVGSPARSLIELIGYTPPELESELRTLVSGERESAHHLVKYESSAFRRVIKPVRDRHGRISGWLLVLNDRTEELELEQMRDDMVHMVVHDLRAPLTTLMGGLDMLRESSKKSKPQDAEIFYEIAERGGKRMLSLINTILELSRLESGNWSVVHEPHDVADIINDAVIQLQPAADEAHVALKLEVELNLPRLIIDDELITRVLYNLVDNAIKFSPDHSTVRIGAKLAQVSGWVEVFIADQGKGITPEVQANLFNKFQRDRKMTARRSGTGLGLYFCRLAVEAHGGKIWVESQVGHGSVFRFLLPSEMTI